MPDEIQDETPDAIFVAANPHRLDLVGAGMNLKTFVWKSREVGSNMTTDAKNTEIEIEIVEAPAEGAPSGGAIEAHNAAATSVAKAAEPAKAPAPSLDEIVQAVAKKLGADDDLIQNLTEGVSDGVFKARRVTPKRGAELLALQSKLGALIEELGVEAAESSEPAGEAAEVAKGTGAPAQVVAAPDVDSEAVTLLKAMSAKLDAQGERLGKLEAARSASNAGSSEPDHVAKSDDVYTNNVVLKGQKRSR